MITNNWIDCNDARKWACLIAMRSTWTIKFGCNNTHKRVLWSWVIKCNGDNGCKSMSYWLDCDPDHKNKKAVQQQNSVQEHHDVCDDEQLQESKQGALHDLNSWLTRWQLQEQTIAMIFARANDCNDHKEGNLHNQNNWLIKSIVIVFVKANNWNHQRQWGSPKKKKKTTINWLWLLSIFSM